MYIYTYTYVYVSSLLDLITHNIQWILNLQNTRQLASQFTTLTDRADFRWFAPGGPQKETGGWVGVQQGYRWGVATGESPTPCVNESRTPCVNESRTPCVNESRTPIWSNMASGGCMQQSIGEASRQMSHELRMWRSHEPRVNESRTLHMKRYGIRRLCATKHWWGVAILELSNELLSLCVDESRNALQHTATHCNTLQHTCE